MTHPTNLPCHPLAPISRPIQLQLSPLASLAPCRAHLRFMPPERLSVFDLFERPTTERGSTSCRPVWFILSTLKLFHISSSLSLFRLLALERTDCIVTATHTQSRSSLPLLRSSIFNASLAHARHDSYLSIGAFRLFAALCLMPSVASSRPKKPVPSCAIASPTLLYLYTALHDVQPFMAQ